VRGYRDVMRGDTLGLPTKEKGGRVIMVRHDTLGG